MGLEFLRDHGGRRVRVAPDQPELSPDEEGGPAEADVDHDYECEAKAWPPIPVEGAPVDWDETRGVSSTAAMSAGRSPGSRTPRATPSR